VKKRKEGEEESSCHRIRGLRGEELVISEKRLRPTIEINYCGVSKSILKS